jgi:uncharacterized membrane protein
MKLQNTFWTTLLLLVALGIGGNPRAAAEKLDHWSFTTIDYLGATRTGGLDINAAGDIVGRYVTPDGSMHGYVRSKHGELTSVDFPGAVSTVTMGINDRGDIVGTYRLPTDSQSVRHGFLRSEGEFTTIEPPGAVFTNPLGIDPAGRIVGRFCTTVPCSAEGSNVHGFLLADGEYTTIDFPGAVGTNAWKINPRGEILGGYTGSDGEHHVFVLTEDGFTSIDLPAGMPIGIDNGGINHQGDIVLVYCDTAPCTGSSLDFHGFLLGRGGVTLVDFPDAVATALFAINARGDIIGSYDDTSGNRHAFLLSKKHKRSYHRGEPRSVTRR